MHLNHLLHNIVDKLPHHSEQAQADLHSAVDLAVEPPPLPDPEATAAEEARKEMDALRAQIQELTARQAELSGTTPEDAAPAASAAKKGAPSV